MIYFTSDLHLFHNNLLKYRTQFLSVDEMNETIITNHNNIVKSNDEVYYIGDISFGKAKETIEIIRQLNGKKHLIRGNHDKKLLKNAEFRSLFELIEYYHEFDICIDGRKRKQKIILCHYPILCWNECHFHSWMLHGHSHGSCLYPRDDMKIYDVGVDCNEFKPVSLAFITNFMNQLEGYSCDHHEMRNIEDV